MEDIREIPEGWKVGVLSDLAEINPKKNTKKLSKDDLVSFIRMEDTSEQSKIINMSDKLLSEVQKGYTNFHDNDILFAKITPCLENGKGGLANNLTNGVGFGSTEFHVLRPKKNCSVQILYQYSKYNKLRKKAASLMIGSAGQQRIQKDFFETYAIGIPTDTEQIKIGKILDVIDQNIEKTEQTIDKYIKIKNGLMDDILTGKRRFKDGKWVEETEFKEVEGVGRIPKEWDVVLLKECTSKISDRDHTTPIYVDNGIPIISPKDFNDIEEIEFDECKYITLEAHAKNAKKTNIAVGDIIFTRIGAGLGKACLVTNEMPEFSILHSAAMIKPLKEIDNYFLLYYMRASYFQKQIGKEIQSIGVPDLGLDKINDFIVVKPQDIEAQKIIGNIIHKNIKIIQKELDYLKKLKCLKSGLMEDLLTGKVRVKI